jgi:hypothetical protein
MMLFQSSLACRQNPGQRPGLVTVDAQASAVNESGCDASIAEECGQVADTRQSAFELLAFLLASALCLGHPRRRIPRRFLRIDLSRWLLLCLRWTPSCLRSDRGRSPLRMD